MIKVISGGKMPAVHLTSSNFQDKTKTGLSLVDFWAPWCGPCQMLGPVIDELADKYSDRILIGKVNVDEEPDLASRFAVMSIPAVVLLKEGHEVERAVGFVGKENYKELIEKHLK